MRTLHLWSVCLLTSAAGAGQGEYEWAGIFEVPDAKYMWAAQKVDGMYADATMKMVALPATEATAEQLSVLAEGGVSLEACVPLELGGMIAPVDSACYQLRFDPDLWQSIYTVNTSGVAAVAFFTEHVPTEFESTAHYLKDSSGEDVEPLAELPDAQAAPEASDTDWAGSLAAAIIVNAVTLAGLVFVAPGISRLVKAYSIALESILSAFAAGALLACAFFLLLFEATHLIAEGWEKEVEVLWRWGTMVLAGFVLPSVIENLVSGLLETKQPVEKAAEVAQETGVGEVADAEARTAFEGSVASRSRIRVIGAVTIGDFFHNLCDGFFIGAAFKGCGSSFGWGVTMGTVLHEFPQELADYTILTGSSVGMTPAKALFLNFLTGSSVVLGVVLINAFDVANSVVGLFLAFGGGVYVYIAAAECMPRVYGRQLSARMNLFCLLAFVVGAIIIGLVLLDHEHCIPDDGSGHGH